MTAAGRPRRLGVYGEDVVPGIDQRIEDRCGKSRGTHEDEVERSFRSGGVHRSLPAPLHLSPTLGGREHSAALHLGELAQDHPALDQGDVVDKENAVEVVYLVLQAGGEQP